MVTFLDDFSRYVFVYYIAHKSEVVDKFIEFKMIMENQLSSYVKNIRTDNGGEYINNRLELVCR